jgi:hypothetical protein
VQAAVAERRTNTEGVAAMTIRELIEKADAWIRTDPGDIAHVNPWRHIADGEMIMERLTDALTTLITAVKFVPELGAAVPDECVVCVTDVQAGLSHEPDCQLAAALRLIRGEDKPNG